MSFFIFSSLWAKVTVFESTQKQLVFDYVPKIVEELPLQSRGAEQRIVKLAEGEKVLLQPGFFLPCKSFWVGVPPNSRAVARVVSSKFVEEQNVQLEKAGVPEKMKTRLDMEDLEKRAAPAGSGQRENFYPESLVRVAEVGKLGPKAVARIEIYPIQFNFSRRRARIFSTLRVAIEFVPTKNHMKPQAEKSARLNRVTGLLLLNGDQAQHWQANGAFSGSFSREESYHSWYKMSISREGMYRLDSNFFKKIGLDSTQIPFNHLHIFYGGGRELPWDVKASEPTLREVATTIMDANGDGFLGKNDALVFYGQPLNSWQFFTEDKRFHHTLHHYARQNVYWLAFGETPRKQMEKITRISAPAETTRSAWYYFYSEVEKLNPEKSGIQWYWAQFSGNTIRKFRLFLKNAAPQDSFNFRIRLIGASFDHHNLKISVNSTELAQVDLPYERDMVISGTKSGGLLDGKNELTVRQISTAGRSDKSFLDWVEFNYQGRLVADSTGLVFYSPLKNENLAFALTGFAESPVSVFDVTDPFHVRTVRATENPPGSGNWVFADRVSATVQKKYLAVSPDQILPVQNVKRETNPLKGLRDPANQADYLIIAPESLFGPDLSLLAAHRADSMYWPEENVSPAVKIVSIEQIYNSFSWGVPDPTAIRNFLKYTVHNWGVAPSYILLVGNACYDMKRNSGGSPPTLVPTHEDGLRATDDWFVFLNSDRIMDMFLGRLSVRNKEELHAVVQKIIDYDTNLPGGPWQGRVLMVADDANSPTYNKEDIAFGRDTEVLCRNSVLSDLEIRKVYLDAYPQDAYGKKEAAKRDFLSQWNKGAAFVNFLGHANLEVLTHESIFYTPQDLPQIQNGHRYPLFFAGTCAVGQFDYDRKPCMAEYLTNLDGRGTVATIASTRWTWHELNYTVNRAFVNAVFARENRNRLSLGEALLLAKLSSRYADHRELITLFGDPAQRLALPETEVAAQIAPDTVSLHRRTHVEATVNHSGKSRGKMFLELRDSGTMHHPEGYSYFLPGEIIYSDTLAFENGRAESDFFPKTIMLNGGKLGQLYTFAWNGRVRAAGRADSISIKRDFLHSYSEIDSVGPQIQVRINGEKIKEGETVTVFPDFRCQLDLQDVPSGILVNEPVKFPVQLVMKNDTLQRVWNLTSRVTLEDSTGRKGEAEISCADLPPGSYDFQISARDRAYNPAEFEWEAEIVPARLQLKNVLNYPNPAAGRTYFTFESSGAAWVTLKIYTLSGRLIQTLESEAEPGFNKVPEDGWDCRDGDGDPLANGVYLYKLKARSEFSIFQKGAAAQTASALGRLVILR